MDMILSAIALIMFINHYFALWAISNMVEREMNNTNLDVRTRYRWGNLKYPVFGFTVATSLWGLGLSVFFPVTCMIGLVVADIVAGSLAVVYALQYLDYD